MEMSSKPAVDKVNHPKHYQGSNGLEVIDVIESFTENLKGAEATNTGNILKYVCRWKEKNGLEDLKKAEWHLKRLIEIVEQAKNNDTEDEEQHDYNRPEEQAPYYYNIKFKTRIDAEKVLWRMEEIQELYDAVSMADMLDIVGIDGDYTDNKYGWKDLRNAHVEQVRDGYIINLPRATKV